LLACPVSDGDTLAVGEALIHKDSRIDSQQSALECQHAAIMDVIELQLKTLEKGFAVAELNCHVSLR
jgi:hypothetical protein